MNAPNAPKLWWVLARLDQESGSEEFFAMEDTAEALDSMIETQTPGVEIEYESGPYERYSEARRRVELLQRARDR